MQDHFDTDLYPFAPLTTAWPPMFVDPSETLLDPLGAGSVWMEASFFFSANLILGCEAFPYPSSSQSGGQNPSRIPAPIAGQLPDHKLEPSSGPVWRHRATCYQATTPS